MKSQYKISIPKPCHEDWSKMTPNERGRFCQMCSKTVVDFTKMDTNAIQQYIHNNKNNRICGHIKQSQLDTINLKISETVFQQKLNFHKVFLLALLMTMGTTLFNCSDTNGKSKKIETIEIVEKQMDTIQKVTKKDIIMVKVDSIPKEEKPIPQKSEASVVEITGDIVIGIVDYSENESTNYKRVFEFFEVDKIAQFKNTPKEFSKTEQKEHFSKKINEFISKKFRAPQGNFNLKGKQRIYVRFEINKKGFVENIVARAAHLDFEKEAKRVIKLLPQFIPAQKDKRAVSMIFTLPIVFEIKE